MKSFSPMLACSVVTKDVTYRLEDLTYPAIASEKLDGIRSVNLPKQINHSRKMKPLPNRHIMSVMKKVNPAWLDGEIVTYTDGVRDDFNTIQSKVMSESGKPDFRYHVFDWFKEPQVQYEGRITAYEDICFRLDRHQEVLVPVPCTTVGDSVALSKLTDSLLGQGFEGAIVRSPTGPYKYGRATWREQWMTKVKPFEDAEGVVIGFVEAMANNNPLTTDELGYAKRSSHKANKIPKGTLGKLLVSTDEWGIITVGSSMRADLAKHIWDNKLLYRGKVITFKYQSIGMKDSPRLPIFKGFRDPIDF